MAEQIDTNSQEHLLNCYARHIIRDIRNEPDTGARERRFAYMLRKRTPTFREAMRERVRRLWKETNKTDGWEAPMQRQQRGKRNAKPARQKRNARR